MSDTGIRVLLVEDHPGDARLLTKVLAETVYGGFQVSHVATLRESLARMEQEPFDVILLDLGLPDSQGLNTLEAVQARARRMPVVVLTGLADIALAMRALQVGAQDYLVKGEVGGNVMARAIRYAIERKRSEEAAQAAEAELAHLSRLSTLGHMATGLAHELNQPLGAILNYATVCAGQVDSVEPSSPIMRTALNELMAETRRAGAIISRMRAFVRKKEPRRIPVSVNTLVDESLHMLGFELRRRSVHPQTRLAEQPPKVLADPVQIGQVLVNLICNALEAMSEPPSPKKELRLETAVRADGKSVEVWVIDSGPGISQENEGRLFEAFFTTKASGLGLGLQISRSIIESHGGLLAAAANPTGGMRFSFTLPVAEGAAL